MSGGTAVLDATGRRILEIIDAHKDEIIAFGRDLWTHAETGFKEKRTAERFADALLRNGIDRVETDLALTGVKGTLACGEGAVIALMGEMDALPLSTHPDAWSETGAAHACGHNAQLTAVMGASIALGSADVRKKLDGTVLFVGVPDEEGVDDRTLEELQGRPEIVYGYGGGKRELIVQGYLREAELAVGHHAIIGDRSKDITVSFGSANGFVNKYVTYHGKSAHSAMPWLGRDAMAAASLFMHAVDLQRETFRDEACVRIHGNITRAAEASNIIADTVSMQYGVRGRDMGAILDASAKFDRSVRAGAVATGCGATIRTTMGYFPIIPTMDKELLIDVVRCVAKESGYSAGISYEMSHTAGSTDYGDITQLMPLLYFETGGFEGRNHSVDFKPVDEYLAYVVPAKVFALLAYALLRDCAAGARRVIDGYRAAMTTEEYKACVAAQDRTEELPGEGD